MQVGKSPGSERGSLVVVYVALGAWAGLVLPGCQGTWPETGGEGVYEALIGTGLTGDAP